MTNAATQTPPRVLFVDDDAVFLGMMKELMDVFSSGRWEILVAQSASQAFATLQAQAVDLAVIDVQMPVMDGVQMLSMLNRSYPNLQKVVLTAYASEKYRAACLGSGAELFLEKPKSQEELHSLYSTLNELIKLPLTRDFSGVLRPVELLEVAQLECTEGNSSIIEFESAQGQGRLFIKTGDIIHAVAGPRKGLEALDFLLSLRAGQTKLLPFTEPAEKTLDGPWEALLLRASQKSKAVPAVGPANAPVEAPRALAAPGAPPSQSGQTEPDQPQVDELLICSACGDVLYGWQCHDTDLWVKLLEFISQKAQRLAEGMSLGDFNRLEILTNDARIVIIVAADRGVVVRSKEHGKSSPERRAGEADPRGSGPASGADKSDEGVKERTEDWLRRAALARGTLVRGVRFADQTVMCDLDSRDFPRAALEQAFRSAADTFAVLHAHRLPCVRLLWRYSRADLHCALRNDGAIFGAFIRPKSEESDLASLDRTLSDFIS